MKAKLARAGVSRTGMLRRLIAVALGCGICVIAYSDTTTLTAANATKGTSSTPVILRFPVARSGDSSYDAALSYHTIDGTAKAGIDYTAASGQTIVPAGAASASIPVTLAVNTGNTASRTFQLGLDAATGIGPAPGFAAQQAFTAGAGPYAATAVDVNGDGKPDLIVANSSVSTISVLLNTTAAGAATPSFAAQQTFATGSSPRAVATADINGDGKPDLITANYNDNTVSVLLNTTSPGAAVPSFASQQVFSTGSNPFSIATADVNGDGKGDLIVANYGSATVSVLLNTAAPGAIAPAFSAQQTFATDTNPNCVTTADIDGDGKADLIVANYGSATLSVLHNTTVPGAATPSFAAQQTFPTGSGPSSVATADVNGDGKSDLIAVDYNSNTASVLLNTTAPGAATTSFAGQQTFPTGTNPYALAVADVNGDGKPDLIVANYNGNSISLLRNTTVAGSATASFAAQQPFNTGPHPVFVAAVDLNGDGKPDLLSPNLTGASASVLLNTTAAVGATLSFAAQQTFATAVHPHAVAMADVNGDGVPDLLLADYGSNTVSVLLNTTVASAVTQSFAAEQVFVTGVTGAAPSSVVAADVNGDGKPDLIVANYNSSSVAVLLNTTVAGAVTPSFAAQQSFATGTNAFFVAAADINGDGKLDLIVANYNGNTVSVFFNTTTAGAATPSFAAQQTFATGTNPVSVAAVDLNGDGKVDLAVANFTGNTVSVLFNTTPPGAAVPTFAVQQTFATGVHPYSVACADINGDGEADLAIANHGDNTISVLLNTTAPGATTPSFAAQRTFATGAAPSAVAIADVNGDGKPDVIAVNFNGNTVSVLVNTTSAGSATPSFAGQQVLLAGTNSFSVATADLNGDGKPDVVAGNFAANTVSVMLNTQLRAAIAGALVTGTIVHDYIFASGFE